MVLIILLLATKSNSVCKQVSNQAKIANAKPINDKSEPNGILTHDQEPLIVRATSSAQMADPDFITLIF
jgi:hypothetical protein